MRIAHLVATFPPYYAGSGNACFYQAEALAARGHKVEVFTASYPGVRARPRRRGHPPLRRPAPARQRAVHPAARADRRIRRHPPAPAVHLRRRGRTGRARANRHAAGEQLPQRAPGPGRQGSAVRRLRQGRHARRAAAVRRREPSLSMEHAREAPLLAAELRRRPEAFAAVPNGVDIETFRPGERARRSGLALGIPADAAVAAFCAKLDPAHLTKRLDLAIEATARVPDLTLLVIGGGPLQARFEAQAREAGAADRVVFAGDQRHEEVARHLRAADLLVMPSTLESFGIVQLEAMATGLPVVISGLPGARERQPRRRARRPRRPGRPRRPRARAARDAGRRPRRAGAGWASGARARRRALHMGARRRTARDRLPRGGVMRRLLLVTQRPLDYGGGASVRWQYLRDALPRHGWEVDRGERPPQPDRERRSAPTRVPRGSPPRERRS